MQGTLLKWAFKTLKVGWKQLLASLSTGQERLLTRWYLPAAFSSRCRIKGDICKEQNTRGTSAARERRNRRYPPLVEPTAARLRNAFWPRRCTSRVAVGNPDVGSSL